MAVLEPMYCSKCGAKLSDESSFCTQCGALKKKIDKSNTQANQQNVNQTFPDFEYSVDMKQPANQQPINQAWTQPPLNQQTTYQQPLNQQPMNQQPINQQAWSQQSINQQPINQQAWNQQPMNQQPINQQAWSQQQVTQQGSMPWQASTSQNGYFPSNSSNEILIQNKKKNWKPKIIAIGAACAFIGLIIVILVLALPKGNKEFYTGTIEALEKNFNSDGFKVTITVDGETVKALTYINPKKSEIAFLASSNQTSEQLALFNGSVFEIDDNRSILNEDISEQQKLVFKYYNKYFSGISGLGDIDLELLLDDIASDSGGFPTYYFSLIDFDQLQNEIKELESKLNDKEFLESNFDYTIEEYDGEINHSLTINSYDFIELLIKEMDYESELFSVVELEDVLDDSDDIDFLIDTTIEDGYLTKLKLTVKDNRYNDRDTIKITFSDFGSDDIKDMLETVEEYYDIMEEDYYDYPIE